MINLIKKLYPAIGEYKKYALLTPLCMVGEVVMEVLIPFITAKIIDVGIKQQAGIAYIAKLGGVMIVMALISLCFGALGGIFAAKAGMGFGKNLRGMLFNRVQDYSFSNVDHFSTASLVTRLTTDVTNAQNSFMMLIRSAIRSPIMLAGALYMAFSMNSRLACIFLVAIPILGGALALVTAVVHPRFKEMLRRYDNMNASVQENLIGIRVVKAFVRERHEKEKFRISADEVRAAQVFAEKIVILNGPVMQLTMYGCIVAILWFCGNLVIDPASDFDAGALSGFISYISQILMSLMMLSFLFIMFIISRASFQRIADVLDEKLDIDDSAADPALVPADGSIRFEDVSFSYSGDMEKCALSHINLSIASGETIGIIGATGSAKSTLVQLIPRLYDVTEGKISVGGRDVKEYKLEALREEVAMVLQKNVLFSGTIRDNLRWGDENATDEEIQRACENAQAHDFIMSFPDGYDTDLGQGGVNVSGGQKQRLCIARALLKKPKIIILDDSTSAVDTATDAKIREAFRRELSETTTIIIAQRISSVSDADRIIVLDDGKISDVGTHDELLERSDIYREVYESQQSKEAE